MTTNAFGLEGQVLVGRYRLIRPLRSGSMGTVWRADDLTLGSPVAIKRLGPLYAKDEAVRARFYQEAQAAAALRSPNVVQILDHGVDDDVPFIAMELLEGEDLAHRLERTGPLSPADTVRIFADVARAVRKAHDAGIVHRDLKPDNIFLARDDDREVAKVLDFGVAKTRMSGSEGMGTQAGVLIGTLPYMSPEQAQGAAVDYRSDLWALGVIAFECVCGRAAITAEAPGAMILEICSEPLPVPSQVAAVPVPPAFDEWFVQACSRDPNERFPSATAMVDALRAALLPAGEAVETGRASRVSGAPSSIPPASAPPVSAPPLSASPLSASPLSASPLSASPLSASPLSASPVSASPASAPPVSTPPSENTAPRPSLDEAEIDDWKPRRAAPVTVVVLGLAASLLGAWLLTSGSKPDSDPPPPAPQSRAEPPPVALDTPPAAPANGPVAATAPERGTPEPSVAPSADSNRAAATTPASEERPAQARRVAPAAAPTWTARALSSTAPPPARSGKAGSSALRNKPQPTPAGAPAPSGTAGSTDRRLGF
ncbi:protein kinase domain-containing protein [Sorangium sp. So ce388]|uniref:serine/threonine-protein kinase n=1 Tax=Sorangium sp. So ce388 TaxID=3133309 RepID=UPI003F5C16AD